MRVRLWPDSIAGQLRLAVIIVLAGAQVLTVMMILGLRGVIKRVDQADRVVERTLREIADLDGAVPVDLPVGVAEVPGQGVSFVSGNLRAEMMPDAERLPRLERRLGAALAEVGLAGAPGEGDVVAVIHPMRGPDERGRPRFARPAAAAVFHPSLPPDPTGRHMARMEQFVVSVPLAPGAWYNLMAPFYPAQAMTIRVAGAMAAGLLAGVLVLGFLSRRIVRPLATLAEVTERFGRGEVVPSAPEDGPREVRRAAAAFNRMQERVARLIDTQRTMLRAVGHDLRTPITRLRMRAELVEDAEERARLVAALEDLTALAEAVLAGARDVSAAEPMAEVDLGALVEAVAEDFTDTGASVDYKWPPRKRVVVRCRRAAVKRALTNLVDNAIRHGGGARIALTREGATARITVEDDGPGIPGDRLAEAMEPFVRLTGPDGPDGTGLGLSIARAVLEAHGGELTIENRRVRGLRAVMVLPG